jgi:hypothetical protein
MTAIGSSGGAPPSVTVPADPRASRDIGRTPFVERPPSRLSIIGDRRRPRHHPYRAMQLPAARPESCQRPARPSTTRPGSTVPRHLTYADRSARSHRWLHTDGAQIAPTTPRGSRLGRARSLDLRPPTRSMPRTQRRYWAGEAHPCSRRDFDFPSRSIPSNDMPTICELIPQVPIGLSSSGSSVVSAGRVLTRGRASPAPRVPGQRTGRRLRRRRRA